MHTIAQVTDFLGRWAPLALAEEWDNVGLLIGDRTWPLKNVLTCLTLTPDVAREAVERQAGLVVSHHPVLFRPVQRITAETTEGGMLLDLIRAHTAVYSPHTGYDSARDGINQQLAELLGLTDISVLRPAAGLAASQDVTHTGDPLQSPTETGALSGDQSPQPQEPAEDVEPSMMPLGAGRYGRLASRMSLGQFNELVKTRLKLSTLQYVGDPSTMLDHVAVACGSASGFMQDAIAAGCQVLLTGEARFHACLEARNRGMAMILTGHYASERPAVERLADVLAAEFPKLTVWPSQTESDPLRWG